MYLNSLPITNQIAIFEAKFYANREDNASLLAGFISTQMAGMFLAACISGPPRTRR